MKKPEVLQPKWDLVSVRRKLRDGFATVSLSLLLEPRDLWVGAYWTISRSVESPCWRLKIYICLVPTLPLLIDIERVAG